MNEHIEQNSNELLTTQEVAKLLQQSDVTILRWRKANKLTGFFRIGRKWLIRKSDLDEFINQSKNN